ncbi:GlmU family protein [Candidatus Cloacimonadota bacterium]
MQIVIFDDHKRANFYPLTLNRSIGDLRCGILKLRQRLETAFGSDDSSSVIIDPILVPLYKERHPDWLINQPTDKEKLYLNSRIKLSKEAIKEINTMPNDSALINDEIILAAKLKSKNMSFQDDTNTISLPPQTNAITSHIGTYECLSDIIHDNGRMLKWDFENYFDTQDNFFETEPGVTVLHPYNVWIAEGVILNPGVILDASEGPIVIDEGVKVMHNAVLCGPLYIGKNSLVKIGAKIYGNTSIGPVCKIGGEIEGSIFQAYSNKQHDGFLGHAYIGEWVNLGADTNNSDLKNTYKNVAYYSYAHGSKCDSGTQFLGCVIGDHSKTGINCSINTGTVIGIGCNIWGHDLFSDFIPDFSWGESKQLVPYKFQAFCETASTVKQRRKLLFSIVEQELYQHINSGR